MLGDMLDQKAALAGAREPSAPVPMAHAVAAHNSRNDDHDIERRRSQYAVMRPCWRTLLEAARQHPRLTPSEVDGYVDCVYGLLREPYFGCRSHESVKNDSELLMRMKHELAAIVDPSLNRPSDVELEYWRAQAPLQHLTPMTLCGNRRFEPPSTDIDMGVIMDLWKNCAKFDRPTPGRPVLGGTLAAEHWYEWVNNARQSPWTDLEPRPYAYGYRILSRTELHVAVGRSDNLRRRPYE